MAQRRMFSPSIVKSEEFLSMPSSSQLLYFHLGMDADDDGFVQPKIVMRVIGAADDDLKVLLAKRFLLSFEGGVVVIKHWLIHNLIQKDRYHPTRFQEEKEKLFIKENKSYTDNPDPVNKMLTEVRLGKDRLLVEKQVSQPLEVGEEEGDDIVLEPLDRDGEPYEKKWGHKPGRRVKEKESVFVLFNPHRQPWWLHPIQREAALRLLDIKGMNQIKAALDFYRENKDNTFCPKIHTPLDLEMKWSALFDFKSREGL